MYIKDSDYSAQGIFTVNVPSILITNTTIPVPLVLQFTHGCEVSPKPVAADYFGCYYVR